MANLQCSQTSLRLKLTNQWSKRCRHQCLPGSLSFEALICLPREQTHLNLDSSIMANDDECLCSIKYNLYYILFYSTVYLKIIHIIFNTSSQKVLIPFKTSANTITPTLVSPTSSRSASTYINPSLTAQRLSINLNPHYIYQHSHQPALLWRVIIPTLIYSPHFPFLCGCNGL
jgi:hypothetical protein